MQSSTTDPARFRTHSVDVALYNLDADGGLVVTTSIPVLLKGKRTSVAVADGQPCPAIVNPNHNDWTFAKIALSADDETLLSEHLGNVADPLSRSMFLAGLSDKAMAGDTSIAAFVRQTLRLAETEKNFVVLEQISIALTEAVDMMQRLRPETDTTLPRALRYNTRCQTTVVKHVLQCGREQKRIGNGKGITRRRSRNRWC